MNFIPTRPKAEIAKEYIETIWTLNEPQKCLKRCLNHILNIADPTVNRQWSNFSLKQELLLFVRVAWHQGIRRPQTRVQFWQQLWTVFRRRPKLFDLYVSMCAEGEHFFEYRVLAKNRISEQLKMLALKTGKSNFHDSSPTVISQKNASVI